MSFLSQVRGRPVYDASGERVGTLQDLVIPSDVPYPPVQWVVIGRGRDSRVVPWRDVESVTPERATLRRRYEATSYPHTADGEFVWLGRDVLDRQIVDITGVKLVRVNDVALTPVNDDLRVAGVDNSTMGLFRRIGMERLAGAFGRGRAPLIDWDQVDISPALTEVRLKVPYDRLQRMHPADIATVVSQMSPGEAADVMEALDEETAAKAMAELPDEHQAAVLTAMEPEEAADVLEEMEPDEAADVLGDVTEERAEELMSLMEPAAASEVRTLMAYAEDTAGGLMNTNIVALPLTATVADAVGQLRRDEDTEDEVNSVYIVDDDGRPVGSMSLYALLVSSPRKAVEQVMQRDIHSVRTDASDEDVARTLVHYGLLSVPVVDDDGALKGVVTISDVIDLFAPRAWRNRPVRMRA
jgi:CBS domain-containing protein/sporulation protein YlmC with PRC-barrel domain